METAFTILLGIGVGYEAIGFVLGEFIGHGDTDVNSISPLKPAVIATFIIVFSAAGLIFMRFMAPVTALPLAGLLGTAVAAAFYRLIIVPLHRAQKHSVLDTKDLIGHQATVTEKILEGQFGKITYVVDNRTYSAPAKSEDGNEIARDVPVEILYIENNAYYVRAQ